MPKARHQEGRVEPTGSRVKKWIGFYYVYFKDENGIERRRHKSIILGLKSEIKKWQAENKLRNIIDREMGSTASARADDRVTLESFWANRFLPIQNWRRSTRSVVTYVMEKYVLPRFGQAKLSDITRFDLQTLLNELAKQYSQSLVHKVRVWTNAILDEAVEQDYLTKNPARKLVMPPTRNTCSRYLTPGEYRVVLDSIKDFRDQLIFRTFVLCALRPGELFALRWKSFDGQQLKIEEAVYRGHLGSPKTRTSASIVSLPESIIADLSRWYEQSGRPNPDSFIFPSRTGSPLDAHNYLQRFLRPLAKNAGVNGLTFQALRRTFATHFHGIGTVKDQQAQMRHANASMTVNVYTQVVPASLKQAVDILDRKLSGELNKIEQENGEQRNGTH